jgi:flagellar biogenesis protein FliO
MHNDIVKAALDNLLISRRNSVVVVAVGTDRAQTYIVLGNADNVYRLHVLSHNLLLYVGE